ncbi:MAG: GIY-YIG nuclease family protein [Myxococcota bacterium]
MRSLANLDVLVVDCQATGASPTFGHVLELGWGVVRPDAPERFGAEAHWIKLPEGHRVPVQVQKLTGYDPSAEREDIADHEAWQRLRAAVALPGGVPTAIHFARFELGFLREWSARFEPEAPFPLDAVCVHAIASRLFPELPRQSLRALAGYLGHSLHLSRRSLGHVEATAFVWRRLCAELATRGIESWEQLQAWLTERAPPKPRSKRPKYPIDSARYRTLPDKPGVYRFLRSNGDVVYVGKARSLKKRTTSHFTGKAGAFTAPEMLTQVSDIAVTLVDSALEAALLENDTIKALKPPYNVQLVGSDQPAWYSNRDFDRALSMADEHHLIGPVPSEYSLRPLSALIALVSDSPSTPLLRAQAVGVSALMPPDEGVFSAGWAELQARHAVDLKMSSKSPRRKALRFAKQLLQSPVFSKTEEELDQAVESSPRTWDPLRVARHMESAMAQAYRAYRRTRWLRLIHDSDVVFREPDGDVVRLLEVRGGEIVSAKGVESGYSPGSRSRPGSESMCDFDRTRYDRLRILTTELKRIVRDGGEVAVYWRGNRRVPPRWLAGVLEAV